jgi:Gp157 protein
MPAHLSLKIEASKYQTLRERLLADWPTLEDDCLLDTLEGITDLHEMIAAVIRSALVDEALQAGLRTRLEEMRQRLARLEERGAKKRQLALDAMCEVGLKKLEQPDFTASARAGLPPLVVVTDDVIPESYWVPQPPKLDRQSLLADLKRGDVIPGAQLGNPKPTLAVRTK